MTTHRMVQTIGFFFKGIWKRHQVTLGLICWAAFECRRLNTSEIGRYLTAPSVPKHNIKRVDRFLGNRRFDDKKAREQFVRLVIGPRKEIEIAVDWTKVRSWPVLVAAMVYQGRAVPLLWAVIDPKKLYKSQNAFEHGLLAWLQTALPKHTHATILMDRGFKRVELIKVLRRFGFSFVIRTGGNVHVRNEAYNGRIDAWIKRRGWKRRIQGAVLRPSRPVSVNIVGVWRKGCREPWVLMTDLNESINHITARYARRFQIEESFRDQKNERFGLHLGSTLIRSATRVERWLLVAAIVFFIALLVGRYARKNGFDKGFRANTVRDRPTHSDFTLGLFFILRLSINRAHLFQRFQSLVSSQ